LSKNLLNKYGYKRSYNTHNTPYSGGTTTRGITATTGTSQTSLNSGYITTSSYSPYNYVISDPVYTTEDYVIHRTAMQMVKDEISYMDNINPEELNKLVGSTNKEDFDLAMNMLEAQGANYSIKILRVIRENYPYIGNLKSILNEWYQKNYLNVSNKYI